MKKTDKLQKAKEREKYLEELAEEITADFLQRQKDRLSLERQWELNMNFLAGNQYVHVNRLGELTESGKTFYWQNREVFNHIAPIIETRLARFSKIAPVISVRPKTDDDDDVSGAGIAEKMISSVLEKPEVKATVEKVTMWSETCGTGFYKILWDNDGGNKIGVIDNKVVYEGDVSVLSVSPFEIFPDSLCAEDIEDCASIIHARALRVKDVFDKYGVALTGEDVGIYSLSKTGAKYTDEDKSSVLPDAVIVIEKFEKPSKEYPNGRLITVAGGKVLYYGELPYLNGENGARTYPFVKQISGRVAGAFFGSSVIERLIPVQRAFNAVKNRKHEFLNRLSMGIMTVEDGSVDVDDLAEEGLSPGKVLVYRQGANPPEMMNDSNMPSDFSDEEDKLANEFVTVSGVADVSSSSTNANLTSGTALEILVEQDNARLVVTAEIIRNCYLAIARHAVRLYAQFMVGVRALKIRNAENKPKTIYADKNAVNSDDVYLENENELLYSNTQKKDMIFKLYSSGLLADASGRVRDSVKEKILSLLGYKDLDYQKGVARLQEEKAQAENEKIRKTGLEIEEIDDDGIHIDEHVRYILSEYSELKEDEKARLFAHLKRHKERAKIKNEKQSEGK